MVLALYVAEAGYPSLMDITVPIVAIINKRARMSSHTILIAGYYGFRNTGDEAILAAMIRDLRAQLTDVDIFVVSGDPKDTERNHQVRAVAWWDLEKIIHVMNICDLVILGGGGLFHDYWGFDPTTVLTSNATGLAFYGGVALLASLLDKPLMLYAVGIGPIFSEMGKLYTQTIAEQAILVSVRDEESKNLLVSWGVTPNKIYVTADPSFGLETNGNGGGKNVRTLRGDPILGVAVRNWDMNVLPEYWEGQVAEAVDNFLDIHSRGRVTFFPFQHVREALLDDLAVSERIQRLLRNSKRTNILKRTLRIEEKIRLMKQCDLVLGMRLHAIIFTIKNGVPAVGLVYDPKVNHVLTQAGVEQYAINLGEVTSHNLGALLEQTFVDRGDLKNHLIEASVELAEKAHESARLVKTLLADPLPDSQPLSPAMESLLKQVSLSLTQSLLSKSHQLEVQVKQRDREIDNLHQALDRQHEEYEDRVNQLDQVTAELRNEAQVRETKHRQAMLSMEKRLSERESAISNLNIQLSDKSRLLQSSNTELNSIKTSRGWKLLWCLWQIRLFFIPRGTRREKLLRTLWQEISSFFTHPIRYFMGKVNRVMRVDSGRISRHAYAFEKYKRNRNGVYCSDFSNLHVPSQKGLVSIVLPVYNGETLIREALDSILKQSYEDFELIAVNDGSQDATGDILEEYARRDKRVQVIHQENQRLPCALSNGFRVAKGEFLTWTSHDNRLKSDYLEKMVSCLQRNPSWDMVYANIDIIGEDGAPLRDTEWFAGYQQPPGSHHIHLPKYSSELNTYPNNFIGGAFLYRDRVNWLIGDYCPWQYTREDYDYWMKVNSLLRLKHVDFEEPVYDYRFHTDSLTHKDESLGITSDRKFLMVFDDFRRDFYLSPMLWFVEVDEHTDDAKEEIETLLSYISQAGHCLVESNQYDPTLFPSLWLPCVFLKITNDPLSPFSLPEENPSSTIRVMLCISDNPLPHKIETQWDVCFGMKSPAPSLKLNGDRRGWIITQDVQSVFNAIDIRTRLDHLRLIEEEIAQPSSERYKLSVIICTYQREEILERAIRSVAHQTLSQKEYEILVVDNNPDCSKTNSLLEKIRLTEFPDCPSHLRLIHCPIQGLSHARNAGISEAKGEILLFLDDDATAEEDILDIYWKVFSEWPNAGVVGGHIILDKPDGLTIPWRDGWERYWSQFITGFNDYTVVDNYWEFPWGANWAARRKALMQIGGFRARYGRRGDDFGGGEEIIAASLIQRLGYTVAVLPQAKVTHHVEADRFTLEHLKQTIRAGLFVYYQAQVELRLSSGINFKQNLFQLVKGLGMLFSIILYPRNPSSKAKALEAYFYIMARMQLFRYQLVDSLRRFRRTRK